MANEKRIKELGALAQIFAQFQGPQLEQAQLAQQGQQSNRNAMLQALGLVQQRTEAEQRAVQARAQNEAALRQLNLTERGVQLGEKKLPLELAQMGEETTASQAKRELAPRLADIETEKNRIEAEKTAASQQISGRGDLVKLLDILTNPQTSPEGQQLIAQGIRGQPGFEPVSKAVTAQQVAKQQATEAARAPALKAQQAGAQGSALLSSGPAVLGGALSPGIGSIRALDQIIGSGAAPQVPTDMLQMLTQLTPSGLSTLSAVGKKKRKPQVAK